MGLAWHPSCHEGRGALSIAVMCLDASRIDDRAFLSLSNPDPTVAVDRPLAVDRPNQADSIPLIPRNKAFS